MFGHFTILCMKELNWLSIRSDNWWQSFALISFYISEYRKFFWANDKDGDGLLSKTEFLAMLQNIGLSLNDRELHGLFQKTDKDGKFRKMFSKVGSPNIMRNFYKMTYDRVFFL